LFEKNIQIEVRCQLLTSIILAAQEEETLENYSFEASPSKVLTRSSLSRKAVHGGCGPVILANEGSINGRIMVHTGLEKNCDPFSKITTQQKGLEE
jgi:hypothetical protein